MFRLLLDENLPAQAAGLLRSKGYDVIHAREAGLRSAPDEAIVAFARSDKRACVTLDRDLHRILAGSTAVQPSVILLRNIQPTPNETAACIQATLDQIGQQLESGIAVTVTAKGLRVRRLPLT
jgi:predicted nuclease of predicted toxin-antitoxin system